VYCNIYGIIGRGDIKYHIIIMMGATEFNRSPDAESHVAAFSANDDYSNIAEIIEGM
jgi:hypothetical protein